MTQLLHRRRALLADLPHAAGTGQLALHFQPLVAPGTGEVRSVEALLRWHHPAFGLVSPGEFIPLAEESGAIVPLGDWALGAACSQLESWDRAAIDDFGTGFSSLAYLRRLRADGANLISTIKIDRSFVSDLGEDAHAGGVVTAILSHTRELELATVAEGVETETQAGFLREQGCDTLQGYRICRPLPADEASAWLGEHAAATA